jgi:hypothetical protein
MYGAYVLALASLGALLACASPAIGQTRISQMPQAGALTGTELLPVLQNGANAVTTPSQLAQYVNITLCNTTSGVPAGGSAGQLEFNNAGVLGGFTLSGDATLNTATGALTVTATNGQAFTPSATTDTTSAANITAGTLPSGRLSGAYTGVTGVGTLSAGSVPASLVTGLGAAATASTTGSGAAVLATSPTLVTPALGTPSAVVLTNATGLPLAGLAAQGANTLVVNATSGSAAPTAVAVPSCSTSASALNYTSSGGSSALTCNTAINAATLNGATFSAPGSIGNGTAGSVHYAGLYPSASGTLVESSTAPTISSGCGSGSAVTYGSSGTWAFAITIGSSPGTTCVVGLTSGGVQHGWRCWGDDITTTSEVVHQTAASTSTCTLTFYPLASATPTAPTASDVILVSAAAY